VAIPRTSSSNLARESDTDSRAQIAIILGREGARGSAITPADDSGESDEERWIARWKVDLYDV